MKISIGLSYQVLQLYSSLGRPPAGGRTTAAEEEEDEGADREKQQDEKANQKPNLD